MKIINENALPLKHKSAIAIGYFDGLHIGHTALVNDLFMHDKLKKIVFTFNGKPLCKRNIFSLEEKEDMLNALPIDYFYIQKFSEKFSNLSPYEFLVYIKEAFNMEHITVGFDFRFGKNANGNAETLLHYTNKLNYTLTVIPEVNMDGIKVSSSEIKKYIERGKVKEAAKFLNKYYYIDGIVKNGKKLGRTMNFPTINITTSKLTPKCGVYATKTQIDNKIYLSVTNVGKNPTVSNENNTKIETHIFNFEKNVYDEKARIYFVDFIREERKFENIDELKEQITKDAQNAQILLN